MTEFKQPVSEFIWNKKYRGKDDKDLESYWMRIAKALSKIEEDKEKWEKEFYNILEGFKFLPGGRIQAGTDPNKENVTLFNCFAASRIDDSIEGILQVAKESAITQKMGGGIGFNFSTIRPRGELIKTIQSEASGPVSFMYIYDAVCQTIQSAGHRRGAQMGMLIVSHPDIEEFITAKEGTQGNKPLTNFNLSVQITDEFMNAVKHDLDFELKFNDKVYRKIKARELWDKIIKHTYDWAEPGIFNIDITNHYNNLYFIPEEKIMLTNPCGEISLPYQGSCLLGSFNLTQYIINPFEEDARFDFDRFVRDIPIALRMLDNVIDISKYPLEVYEKREKISRRVGMGITGYGDALSMLRLRYGSSEALKFTEEFMRLMRDTIYRASVELAREKGPFPYLKDNIEYRKKYIEGNFVKQLPDDIKDDIVEYGIRNAFLLAIAPTGTISILANNVSSGLEPIFSNEYTRRIKLANGGETEETVMDYAYKEWRDKFGDRPLPEWWVTTHDLTVDDHLNTQAMFQKYIDLSISKTINVPQDYPFEDFRKVYEKAYDLGLKGVTTFRPGKIKGILTTKEEKEKEKSQAIVVDKVLSRPQVLHGTTYKLKTPKAKYAFYVTINDYELPDGRRVPFEIFINTKNTEHQSWITALTRVMSAVFRKVEDPSFLLEELWIYEPNGGYFDKDGEYIPSIVAGIGKILRIHLEKLGIIKPKVKKDPGLIAVGINGGTLADPIEKPDDEFAICPECGRKGLKVEEGCAVCIYCGYSKCE